MAVGRTEDTEIIDLVLGGDVNAFERLLEKYESAVLKTVSGKVPNEAIAEVVHEVFVRSFQSLSGYQGKGSFERWLKRIALRTCCDFWRQRYQRREIPESGLTSEDRPLLENLASESDPALDEAEETRDMLNRALNRLSPEDRMVLTLTILEGYSVAEAADLLGWTSANVKVRSFRARAKLRRIISRTLDLGK